MKNRFVLDTWSPFAILENEKMIYWVKDQENGTKDLINLGKDGLLVSWRVKEGEPLNFLDHEPFLRMSNDDFTDMVNQLSTELNKENSALKKINEYKDGVIAGKDETISVIKEITMRIIDK